MALYLQHTFWQQNFWFFLIGVGILGLVIGSFLNVVIYRLPLMLEQDWREQCYDLLNIPVVQRKQPEQAFNLSLPRSHCPQCKKPIRSYENIPLLSYLFLYGKCSQCGHKISIQYPLIELASALSAIFLVWHYGISWQALFATVLTWSLLCLVVIDLNHQLLPDNLTLSLLWLGLFANLFGLFAPLNAAIIGAIAGYLSLWLIMQLYKLLSGKQGMGHGDFKLLALFGAWLGWQVLPLIVLLASILGAIVGISLIVFRRHDHRIPIPFGPYLAFAGWIALLWGDSIVQWYVYL